LNILSVTVIVALLLAGCSRQTAAQRDALESSKPGYLVAKSYCSQCHELPFADQHPPAAWPYVVLRMQGYMESAHKRVPDPAESKAIIGYFEAN